MTRTLAVGTALLAAIAAAEARAQEPPAAAEAHAQEPPAAAPVVSSLDGADGLDAPRPGVRPQRRRPPEDAGPPWGGPRVELGWSHYVLADGHGGGAVHAFSFGGYAPLGRVRLGALIELGSRDYSLGQNDLLVRGMVAGGYQHLVERSPLLPYVVATASVGGLFGKRFHTTETDFLYGLGLEAGLDVNLVRNLFAGISLGYARLAFGGVAGHVLEIRLRIGL